MRHTSAETVNGEPERETAPAFQFYVMDFLGSGKVSRMSMTERGIYITLLSHSWRDKGLPTDLADVADLVHMKPEQFERVWHKGPLHRCWQVVDGRLKNERQERVRAAMDAYREQQRQNALKGGRPRLALSLGKTPKINPRKPTGLRRQPDPNLSSDLISSDLKEQEQAPAPPDSDVVLAFPLKVGSWLLRRATVDGYQRAYPNHDVLGELRKAHAWCVANADKRKTATGMPRFLVAWLNRAESSTVVAKPAGWQPCERTTAEGRCLNGRIVGPDGQWLRVDGVIVDCACRKVER